MAEPAWEIVTGFRRQAQTRPTAPALLWHGIETSYGELYGRALVERDRISALGPRPGQPVGILADKSPAAVALVLGALLAERPFLLPSPALADVTLATLFAQAGCTHVLSPAGQERDLPAPGPVEVPEPLGDDIAFMLTTSGSTGLPKIVPLPGAGVDRFAAWAAPTFGIGPGRSVLNVAPLNFDLCLLDVWTTLAYGGRVVLVDPAHAANGRRLHTLLTEHEVHVVQAVPMFFGLLAEAAATRGGMFERVEHVMFTGDAIAPHVLGALPGLFPGARVHNIYGCTETNDSFVHEVDGFGERAHPVPIGDPLPGVATLVVTGGAVLHGPGEGELYVSTPFQATGYLDRARTAEKFVAHPAGADDRTWFRTGDLVRRDAAGSVELIGRADFQVKVRGVAVNTAEVEAALLAHPDVLEAAVRAVPDPIAGRVLAAAVHRAPGSGLTSLALREHCVATLPRNAVPSSLRLSDEPLPKTATGKVDRTAVSPEHVERRVS